MQEADDAMDLEMQLLTPSPTSSDSGGSSARQMIHRAILVVKSVQIFLAGTDHGRSPSVSRASSSKSLVKDENARIEEKGKADLIIADQTTPLLKAERKSEASNGLASSPEHHIDIYQLQRSDNKTILEIVPLKDLKTLQEYGGLRGVADALGTDLVQGIFENEVNNRSRLQTSSLNPVPTHTIFHFVWAELLNKTVLLLSLVVALSLVIGINEEGLENGWYDGVVVLIAIVLLVFFGSIRKYWQERRAYNKNMEATKADVKAYRDCGIKTVIISSKKVPVLENIALQCGVIANSDSNHDLVITAEDFRNYTNEERLDKVDKIRVLGEAIPSDKLRFVETLREKGEVVAFLGQRTDEAPTLRAADIGIAMGTWSSMKARESCDIIIWDGSFTDLMSMVNSGKCIYHNIQGFLQLVLITTTSSTLINFIETAASGDASLTIVQLVWVNMAVTFLGGLALLTKISIDKRVSLVPLSCETSIITAQMVRNILVQITYQGICSAIIHLKGSRILVTSEYTKAVVSSIFISCQFFNQFNARELEKKNFFKGIHLHIEFWVAIGIFIVLDVIFVIFEESIGYGTRLNWKLWAICVGVGVVSWVVDWLGKCILWFI